MAEIYHANFRNTDPRPSRRGTSVTFGAASDGVAAAVAAELGNWTTGQLTSLTGDVGGEGTTSPYPTGTRLTVQAVVSDDAFNAWRVQFRNATPQLTGNLQAAVVALLTGSAYADAQYTVTALSAAPSLPNSGGVVAVVNAFRVITKY